MNNTENTFRSYTDYKEREHEVCANCPYDNQNQDEFSFSDWLASEIKKQGISVKELSERSDVSEGSIYKYKKCERSPSIMAVIDILNALNKKIVIVDK